MLSFKKYGFGKVGYVETTYTITDDFKLNLTVKMSKETDSKIVRVNEIELTKEEIELAKTLQANIRRDQQVSKSFIEEPIDKYEDEELVWNGKSIKDERRIKEFKELSTLISASHIELSNKTVAVLYDQLEAKTYQKAS